MTSRDEALRALEKEMRDSLSESNATHTHLRAKGWADRLAAILSARQEWQPEPCPICEGFCGDIGPTCTEQRESARQEVAPVAYMEPVTFNASSAADFAEAMRKWPDDYDDWFPVYRESPAHTSEARDAVLQGVRELAIKAAAHWDADEDMKVGKILMALAGQLPKYDKRADAFDAALEASP